MPVKQGREGVRQEMHKFKAGTLHSGSKTGPIVKDRKQALAIALSEAGLSKRAEGGRTREPLGYDLPEIRQTGPLPRGRGGDFVESERASQKKLYIPQSWGDRNSAYYKQPTAKEMSDWADSPGAVYPRGWTGGGRYARGGGIGYDRGGSTKGGIHWPPRPWQPRPIKFPKPDKFRGFKPMEEGGFIDSPVPGRTDKHYVTVNSGSYVLPADHVSAIGQSNSVAGAELVKKMFGPGTKFGPRLTIPKFAGGGSVEAVPIVVAGGEVILPPSVVRRIGNGDLEKGHTVLDRWVMETRKKHISKLKELKPPKGS